MGAAYLELPYLKSKSAYDKNAEISLLVFLPEENTVTAVDDMLEKFTEEMIQTASNAMMQEVDVQFPKISLDGTYILGKVSFEFKIFFLLN